MNCEVWFGNGVSTARFGSVNCEVWFGKKEVWFGKLEISVMK